MLTNPAPSLAMILDAYAVGSLTMLLAVALIEDVLTRRQRNRDGEGPQGALPNHRG